MMPVFHVHLVAEYSVIVEAETPEDAKHIAASVDMDDWDFGQADCDYVEPYDYDTDGLTVWGYDDECRVVKK